MFGRVGGLQKNSQRHDLLTPVGIIDEADLRESRALVYPLSNELAKDGCTKGNIYSSSTVINETQTELENALEHGCSCVEMEARETVEAINSGRRRYNGKLDVHFGFVGYVSDLPLQGDTLAEEMDSDKGEQDAVRMIVEKIKSE